MLGFFLKKNFCDGWDNILALAVYNIVCVVLVIGFWFFGINLSNNPVGFFISLAVFASLFMIFTLAINQTVAKFADYKYVSFKETLSEIPGVIKDAFLTALFFIIIFYLGFLGIPFYLRMGNLLGVFLGAVVFWILIISVLALQWYFPIRAQLGNNFLKAIKKSYIVFFDNAGFSVFMFIYTIFLFVLSFVLAFLVPGISGILLGYNNAFRLRLYKYDWLEEHTEIPLKQARRQIPWDELLQDDRDTLGPRSLKSFIFPWKD